MKKVSDVLRDAVSCLNELNIEYAVVGGFAVMYHGRPRATADLDIVAAIDSTDAEKLVFCLKKRGFFAEVKDLNTALEEKSHCTVEDKETLFRLDIKGKYDDSDRRALDNRVSIEWEGTKMFIASAEDTVINKLLWGREQDLEDALSIIIRTEDIDEEYLKDTARKVGVIDLLKALEDKVD